MTYGWASPRVGVGADWTEDDYNTPVWGGVRRFGDAIAGRRADETDEERQRRERYAWNPPARLEEQARHTQQNPWTLPADVVGLAGEALGNVAQYPLGVAAGLGQTLQGGDPGGPGWLHTNQPRTLQDVVEPAKALQRWEETPTPVRLPAELAVGMAAPTVLARAARPAVQAGGAALDAATGWSRLQPLEQPIAAGLASQIGEAVSQPAVQVGMRAGVPAAAGVGAALDGPADQPWQERVVRGGAYALGAGILSNGIASVVQRVGRGAQEAAAFTALVHDPATLEWQKGRDLAERIAGGGAGATPVEYKGGYARFAWDTGRELFTDRGARLQTNVTAAEALYGSTLPPSANPYIQNRLSAGTMAKAKVFLEGTLDPIIRGDVAQEQLRDYDALRDAWRIVERAQDGHETGKFKDIASAQKNYRAVADAIDETWGGPFSDKWIGADTTISNKWAAGADSTIQRWSDAMTARIIGRPAEGGHGFEPGELSMFLDDMDVANIWNGRRTHVTAKVVENLNQKGILEAYGPPPRLVAGKPVQEWYSTDALEHVSLDQDRARIVRLLDLAQKARGGNAWAGMTDLVGAPGRNVFGWPLKRLPGPDVAAEAGAKKAARTVLEELEGVDPAGPGYSKERQIAIGTATEAGASLTKQLANLTQKLPAGWQAYPMKWENGQMTPYAAPKYMESHWMGMNEGQRDLLTGFAGKLQEGSRSAMTVFSVPFLLANGYRHLSQALRQDPALAAEGPLGVAKTYVGSWLDLLAKGSVDALAAGNPAIRALEHVIPDRLENALRHGAANVERWERSGGGGATVIEGLPAHGGIGKIASKLQRFESTPMDWTKDGISMVVKSPYDLMKGFAYADDAAPRLSVFKAHERLGEAPALAAFASRQAPFDYAKGGTLMRLINSWVPFVNVHTQATSQALASAWEDPDGYMWRSAVTTMVPMLATYAWNEAAFPGLQQKLPQWKRDAMFNIIVGKFQNPQGEELPITVSLKKDEGAMLMTNPVEYFLDAQYHTKRGKEEIPPGQRHSQSAQEMMLNELLTLQPFHIDAAGLSRGPLGAATMAFLTGNPVLGTFAQMHTNYDSFRNSPITAPAQMDLPPEYRATDRTTATARLAAQFMKAAHVPLQVREEVGSPTNLEFMAREMGGWAGTVAPHVIDQWWDRLAQAGLAPDPSLYGKPMTPADLGLPKDAPQGVVDEYLARIPPLDNGQPWWSRLGILISTAGSAETTRARVEHSLSPDMRRQHDQTTEFWQAYEREQSTSRDRIQEIMAHPEKWTHDQLRTAMHRETEYLRGAREGLHGKLPHAIIDRRERQAFEANLPGLGPLHPEDLNGPLPEGFDLAAFGQQYQAPPGGEAGGLALAKARARLLQQTAQQTGVSRTALMDAMAAQVLGSAPALIVPDLALEDGVERFLHPPGIDPTTAAPRVVNQAREAQLQALAQEWQVTPQEVQTRIRGRLSRPGLFSPLETSEKRAELVRDKLAALPKLVNAQGQTIDASPQEIEQIEARVASLRAKKTPREQWPSLVRQYDTARHNAKVLEISTLAAEPYASDYEAWYGIGRNQTIGAWNDYQSGQVPRYKTGTPADWAKWDLAIRLYRALPADSPRRRSMAPQVRQLEQRQTAGWSHLMQADTGEE